jgi:hypothetical protein
MSPAFVMDGRSQCPRGLRRGSADFRLLGLRVQIPPGAWMSVACECYVLSGRCFSDRPITRPEECSVSECDRGTSQEEA